jgi:methylaspartate mutase epsilon subunit
MPEIAATQWEQSALSSVRADVLRDPTAGLPSGAALAGPRLDFLRTDQVLARAARLGRPLIEVPYTRSGTARDAEVLRELCSAGADQVSVSAQSGQAVAPLTDAELSSISCPLGIRLTGSGDPRAVIDALLAAGLTCYSLSLFEQIGGDRDADAAILRVQYADRLAGYYAARGIPVVRECTASSGGALVPPALSIAFTLIEASLAVSQGVRELVVTYDVMGNTVQDVAAICSIRSLGRSVLGANGEGPRVHVAASQWYAPLPRDKGEAYGLALAGTTSASLARADVIVTAQPTFVADPADPVRAARQVLNLLRGQSLTESDDVVAHVKVLCTAVTAIIDQVRVAGGGDLALGLARLVEQGLLDDLQGSDIGQRDEHGAVRWARQPTTIHLPAQAMAEGHVSSPPLAPLATELPAHGPLAW